MYVTPEQIQAAFLASLPFSGTQLRIRLLPE